LTDPPHLESNRESNQESNRESNLESNRESNQESNHESNQESNQESNHESNLVQEDFIIQPTQQVFRNGRRLARENVNNSPLIVNMIATSPDDSSSITGSPHMVSNVNSMIVENANTVSITASRSDVTQTTKIGRSVEIELRPIDPATAPAPLDDSSYVTNITNFGPSVSSRIVQRRPKNVLHNMAKDDSSKDSFSPIGKKLRSFKKQIN